VRDRFAPGSRPSRAWPTGAAVSDALSAPVEGLAEGEEVVAGRRPVEEAFAARREAHRLLVVPERRAALDQIVLHATTLRIPVVEVEGGSLTAIAGFDGHQGVALVVAARRWATIDDVLSLARSRAEAPLVLVLDHLEDPQNVGTLLRSAEACGVHGVLFPTQGAAPISPAAVKTSAGAVEHLLLVPLPDLGGGLVDLHTRGLRIIGADGDASLTVREVDMRGPLAVVIGSEGRGLNARVRRRVDVMARIPMRGRVASLNASVAGSVFLFEASMQRSTGLPPDGRDGPSEVLAGPPGPDEGGAGESDPAAGADATPGVSSSAQDGGAGTLAPRSTRTTSGSSGSRRSTGRNAGRDSGGGAKPGAEVDEDLLPG
jgi:23S rRNA (guanosine2251-2'-O)-methyltransferase